MPDSPAPPQVTMGLLEYLTRYSLDQDYTYVAERAVARGEEPAPRRRLSVGSAFVLLMVALMLTVAAIKTSQNEPVRRASRATLVAQVQEARTKLAVVQARRQELADQLADTQSQNLGISSQGRAVAAQLSGIAGVTGIAAVQGPGLRVVVDDATADSGNVQVVLDTDLQVLVNGLWNAGAEAVAINGQRLTSLSAIRIAGEAVTVNYHSLTRPYVITAIGDPQTLEARFVASDGAAWWFNLNQLYAMRFDYAPVADASLPAIDLPALRHAVPVPVGGSGGAAKSAPHDSPGGTQ